MSITRKDLGMTISGYFHQIKFPLCCKIWTYNEHIPNLQQDLKNMYIDLSTENTDNISK